MSQNRFVDVIGVQLDEGACKRGVDMGPSAIRCAGLINMIQSLGYDVADKGDIICDSASEEEIKRTLSCITEEERKKLNSVFAVNNINTKLYHSVKATLENGRFPIVIGGDHALAAGSIMAVQNFYQNIGVIWIDAHGDFNDAESSPSGNMHGMPLSAVTGFGPSAMLPFMEEGTSFINPKNVVLIGSRLLDDMERERMKMSGVTVFTTADIDRLGAAEVVKRAIEIAGSGTKGIHTSYDLDGLDPISAVGVGTPVGGGLTYREGHLIAEMIAESGKLLSFEVVELNPILDERNRTGVIAAELILSLLGKTIY